MQDYEKGASLSGLKLEIQEVPTARTNSSAALDLSSFSVAETQDTVVSSPETCDSGKERLGLRAYLTVYGAFISLLVSFGQMNAFGTFQTWYGSHQLQHLSESTISWIGSVQLLIFFLAGAPIGRCFDACGPKGLLTAGSFIFTLSLVLTSISMEYWQYMLSQGVLFGSGVALMFYPSLASVTTHFREYRATALGIAAAGSSVGGVVYPIMLKHLFDKVGFAWGVRASALVGGVGCVMATLTISVSREVQSAREANKNKCSSTPYVDWGAFKDLRFSLLAFGSCFVALGLYIPYFYVVEYAKQLPISPHITIYTLSAMNAGGIPGRIAPAYLADKLGQFNLLIPAAFLSGVLSVAFWLNAHNLGSLLAFAILYGFTSGAFVSVLTPCIASISKREVVGTRMGMLYSVISVPSLLGNPVAGALLARGLSHAQSTNANNARQTAFDGMIIFTGVSILLGSFVIFGSKLAVNRRAFAKV